MLNRLIDFFLDRPFVVAIGLAGLIVAGAAALLSLPIDAFPDLTNNQVTVVTEAPGMAPVEIEQLVTFPVESAMMGIPDTLETRSVSKFGLSMITVVFEDDVPPLLARQLVNERLLEARERIPAGFEPILGLLATPFGEVFQYTMEGEGYSAMELKTVHDWDVKYQLRATPGVADVVTWGGLSKQFEVIVDPDKLQSHDLTLRDVFERVRDNNANFSGGFVEHASEQYTVRGLGRAITPEQIEDIVVKAAGGIPVLLKDVGEVRIGSVPRQGAVTRNGERETLSGMVVMLKGQNSKTVIERAKTLIAGMGDSLPAGVRLEPFYDQSQVIDGTIRTVRNNLLEGGALVIATLFLSLGQIRAAFMVALVIPLSMLFAFLGMRFFDVSANLMSLGAVDFGIVIDGAVVMVDNCVRRIEERSSEGSPFNKLEEIRAAAHEVALPVLAGITIVTAVYLPVFSLQGLEGRMFRPMALTVCTAVFGSLMLALFAIPTSCRILKPEAARSGRSIFGFLRPRYSRALGWLIGYPSLAAVVAVLLFTTAVGSLAFIGTEFMPRLDEGSILVQTTKLPSVSLSQSVRMELEVQRRLREFPEVTQVVSKIGRPDFATEAMGIHEADLYVNLLPRSEWTTASTKEGLIDAMAARLDDVPGVLYNFTQPMAMRLDETASGVTADVAVKVFGDDAATLEGLADEIRVVLSGVDGAADVQREIFSGAAEWQIEVDRKALARYGLNVSDVEDAVASAVDGKPVTEVIDGRRRFRIVVRLIDQYRADRASLGALLLQSPGGERVPLGEVTEIRKVSGPAAVNREQSQRRLVVQCNVRGRDIGGFVADAQTAVSEAVDLPVGYFLRWGGQFEHQERAMERLAIVLPTSIAIIFLICYGTFRSVKESILVLMLVPFATVGGIAALWLRDMNLNVSAMIGFITVFGIATLDGLVLVSAIKGRLRSGLPMRQALLAAGELRLRPVIMTSVVAALGLLPMATATSTGAEVQRPLATVVIGGLISSTTLTLLLTPTLYPWFRGRRTAAPAGD